MIKATKIKMKPYCGSSNNLLEIDSIYLTGCNPETFYAKAAVYDWLVKNPNTIQVDISPFPYLIPELSSNYEKYVRSTPDSTKRDNLLSLPRE